MMNAWAPIVMAGHELFHGNNNNCHENHRYSSNDLSFLSKQFDDEFAQGDKAVYECYDDFRTGWVYVW